MKTIKVKKFEKGHEPRIMQFTEFDWKRIVALRQAGVRWEILPDTPPVQKPITEMEEEVEHIQTFEEAVKEGIVKRGRGGYFFMGDKNLGRIDAAVEAFYKL